MADITHAAPARRAAGRRTRLAPNLFQEPLANSMLIGTVVAATCVLLGGFLAWLVVMTNVPYRRTIGVMATLPFMIPSFASALAWGTLFRNDRLGGEVGFLQGLGASVPDWLAWGMVPTLVVLSLHYFWLAFTIIAASLATVSSDLVEGAQIASAKGRRILLGIVLPVVTPALAAAGSLCFAGAVSNFATPALLGLPVRMQTLATRLYGMIEVGQTDRGSSSAACWCWSRPCSCGWRHDQRPDPSRRLAIAGFAIAGPGIVGALTTVPAFAQGVGGPAARRPTPMIKMIITIKRREGMSHEEFVRYQRDVHRPLLMAIPEARRYIRRFVVSYPIPAPGYSGPDYDSVVEGWFESIEDMNALCLSENFLSQVDPDHANFMDLSAYGRVVAREEVVIDYGQDS